MNSVEVNIRTHRPERVRPSKIIEGSIMINRMLLIAKVNELFMTALFVLNRDIDVITLNIINLFSRELKDL